MSHVWARIFGPLICLFVFVCICLPARVAVMKWMPEGKLKRLLLTSIGEG
jgi:hypothetical protein